MKIYYWDIEKNESLKNERAVSFEDVLYYISKGKLVTIIQHPSPDKYP